MCMSPVFAPEQKSHDTDCVHVGLIAQGVVLFLHLMNGETGWKPGQSAIRRETEIDVKAPATIVHIILVFHIGWLLFD